VREDRFTCTRGSLAGGCGAILLVLLLGAVTPAGAQTGNAYEAERKRAFQLCDESRYLEAIPILEKLTAATPSDTQVLEHLAVALVANAVMLQDAEAQKKMMQRARSLALRAKELGDNSALVQMLLEQVPEGGGPPGHTNYSTRPEANRAMQEGEEAFAKGDFDRAIAAYQRALQADPKLYEAPLYIGDAYYKKKETDTACEWYAKAVAIDPNREAAYRYWGDVLMRSNRLAEARPKFIDAIIAEPYSRAPYRGLMLWAKAAGVTPAPPEIPVPEYKPSATGGATITVDPDAAARKDGTEYWMVYQVMRAAWAKGPDLFRKAYPNETQYRHSLREEAEAVGAVADLVAKDVRDAKVKQLNPALEKLLKLREGGLLEAYVLLARADDGIARDYPGYRAENREKLRRYLSEFVVPFVP